MIPLNVSIEHSPRDCPEYCVRLYPAGEPPPDSDPRNASYRFERDRVFVQTERGEFSFRHTGTDSLSGDVIVVHPTRGVMQRLIRKDANTNSILVTEECDQLCVMCSQPPKQKRYDRFDLYFEAVQLAPQGAVIGITGGEPTLLAQQLLAFIQDSCSARPDVAFHILSNGQHFARLPRGSLKGIAAKILWGIPIYAPDPALHDRIVGKIGAYETLMDSFNWLFAERATVELRTVVMAQNLQALPHLADFICTHLRRAHHWAVMQLENYGYGKLNWAQIFADTSLDFCDVARALRRCERAGIETRLYNFPLCTVPVELRARAAKSISDWKQKYLPDCEGCQQRQICCGFFEWYNVDAGFARISPLSGVPA